VLEKAPLRPAFTVDQLVAFIGMLEKGNVTRTAESFHLSQSTVTHHLKSFQKVLGLRLFEQVGRNIRPTDAGLELASAARVAVRAMRDLMDAAAGLSKVETGVVRIAASQTTISHYLPAVIGDFLFNRPGVSVDVVPGNTVDVCYKVASAEVDLGLIEGPLAAKGLVEHRLARDEVVLVVATTHLLAARSRVSRRDLLIARYLAREVGSGTELIAEEMLRDVYHLVSRVQIGQMDAVRAAVRAGVGFAALPRIAVQDEIKSGLLTVLPIRPHSRWIRAIRRSPASGPATEALWSLLRNRRWSQGAPQTASEGRAGYS
jgi:DNA-binding transcriptional LysR family regulator